MEGGQVTLLAIDPGASGGLAIKHGDQVEAFKMPETPRDTCDIIKAAIAKTGDHKQVKCYMEKVGGFIAGNPAPGSAMFNFGKGVGEIHGMLIALQVAFEEVPPQRWQRALGIPSKGLARAEYTPTMTKEQRSLEKRRVSSINNRINTVWKNRLKEMAQQLNPWITVTLKTSDTLLILEYAKRQERGAPDATPIVMPQPPQQTLTL
jgi:hypothetical protein